LLYYLKFSKIIGLSIPGYFFNIKAPTDAVNGEMNIAIKIATWLASVKDAGSSVILMGEIIGITMPNAQSKAEIDIVYSLLFLLILKVLSNPYNI